MEFTHSLDRVQKLPGVQSFFEIADGPRDIDRSREPSVLSISSTGFASNSATPLVPSSTAQGTPIPESQTRRSSVDSFGSHESTASIFSSKTEWSSDSYDGKAPYHVDSCGMKLSSLKLSGHSRQSQAAVTRPAKRRASDSRRSSTILSPRAEDKAKKERHSTNERDRRKILNIQMLYLQPDIPDFVQPVTEKVMGSVTNKREPAKTVVLERSIIHHEAHIRAVKKIIAMGLITTEQFDEILEAEVKGYEVELPGKMDHCWRTFDVPKDRRSCNDAEESPKAKRSKNSSKVPNPSWAADQKCKLKTKP